MNCSKAAITGSPGRSAHISLCRPGNEELLWEELQAALAHPPRSLEPKEAGWREWSGAGWIAWQGRENGSLRKGPPSHLIFERQRLPMATHFANREVSTLAEGIAAHALPRLAVAPPPYCLHVFPPDPAGSESPGRRAARLETALDALWRERAPLSYKACLAPDVFRSRQRGGTVWQVLVLPDEAWSALTSADALCDPYPGGAHRMAVDPGAPSRSYLKLEEALEVLGRPPRPRERAIDLGAAPGGWSYALLKRGCRVLAVDNGPLKIVGLSELPGELTHLREDGLRFRPPPGWEPADWLLADMLIAPGVCLGLLRKWLGGGRARRFVVNVKLPQRHPLAALEPLRAYLADVPGLSWRLRQLYHDRREVTLTGALTAAALVHLRVETARLAKVPGRGEDGRSGKPGPAPASALRRRGTGKGGQGGKAKGSGKPGGAGKAKGSGKARGEDGPAGGRRRR